MYFNYDFPLLNLFQILTTSLPIQLHALFLCLSPKNLPNKIKIKIDKTSKRKIKKQNKKLKMEKHDIMGIFL